MLDFPDLDTTVDSGPTCVESFATVVSQYTVLEQIGEGGCVWR
jgi:hypothetical protein